MKEEYKSHKGLKIFIFILIIFLSIFIYGKFINPKSLKVKEIAIYDEALNKDYNGLKIAHFSDIHYGRTTNEKELKKVVDNLNELNPDIVIFTGDLFDSKSIAEKSEEIVTKYFQKINAKLFKFAIIGDYDEKYQKTYLTVLDNSNFTLLNNESKLVYYNSKIPLTFIGLTDTNKINDLYNDENFKITLIHKPDSISDIKKSNIVFAGHSLGGQVKIPFIGGIKKIDGANTYIDNYYKVNNKKLYISNGIGTQDFSFRLFNTPSITLYRLYNS